MPLNQNQQQQAQNWLNQHGSNFNCEVCNSNNWQVGDIIAPPVMDSSGNVNIGGQTVPMLQVICGNCASIRFFAAVPMGIIESNQ